MEHQMSEKGHITRPIVVNNDHGNKLTEPRTNHYKGSMSEKKRTGSWSKLEEHSNTRT